MPEAGSARSGVICNWQARYIDLVWPVIERQVARALPYALPTHTTDDYRDALKAGEFHLMTAGPSPERPEIVVIVEFQTYPRVRILHVMLAAGVNMNRYRHALVAQLDKMAKLNQCTFVTASGRAGWIRAAGFEPVGQYMARSV